MDKRGQVYILVALVMSIIIFGMVTISNKFEQESIESSFEDLANNYAVESSKLINSLIEDGEDIPTSFRDFSVMFTSYSKTQNQNFELIYVFDYENTLYVGNYLKNMIIMCLNEDCSNRISPMDGCYSNIPAAIEFDGLTLDVSLTSQEIFGYCEHEIPHAENLDTVYVTIADITYPFDIRKESPEVIVVSRESRAQQRKVFTGGSILTKGGESITTLSDYCHNADRGSENYWHYCSDDYRARCGILDNEDECNINDVSLGGDCEWIPNIGKCHLAG